MVHNNKILKSNYKVPKFSYGWKPQWQFLEEGGGGVRNVEVAEKVTATERGKFFVFKKYLFS